MGDNSTFVTRSNVVVVAALVAAAIAAVGCGLGAGDVVGGVSVTVTRDYGSEVLLEKDIDSVTESDTVMRALDDSTDIKTKYGDGFVDSIDGLAGGTENGRPVDWFFYVNGIESGRGAADFSLHGNESIWWDFRDWLSAQRVPAVVGQFPEPFASGYDGTRWPTVVQCMGGGAVCDEVTQTLKDAGAAITTATTGDDAIRVLVGPWSQVGQDKIAGKIDAGPATSGVFARFDGTGSDVHLISLDQRGETSTDLGSEAGLVAATRVGEEAPVWVITGGTISAVENAAGVLDSDALHNHYAVSAESGGVEALPAG